MITFGCDKDNDPNPNNSEESFLPMQIGNYWKNNEQNHTEITDTLRIEDNLYYKFYSLTGGEVIGTQYLRIDDDQNLIESSPNVPNFKYLHAKFNAELGSTFWTINDKSVNDLKATVTEKEDTKRTFEFQIVYHQNLKDKYSVTYHRGIGWIFYKEVKINGVVHNF